MTSAFELLGEAAERFRAALNEGSSVGISQSGRGSIDEQGCIVEYQLGTFDFVADPPVPGAYLNALYSITDAYVARGGGWTTRLHVLRREPCIRRHRENFDMVRPETMRIAWRCR